MEHSGAVNRRQLLTDLAVVDWANRADRLGDPNLLRLENLDTDIAPHAAVLAATRDALERDASNSYLPFIGNAGLRKAVVAHVGKLCGREYDWDRQCVITAGGLNGILNALLAITDPGDSVLLTDPTYVGLINRVRLAGCEPVFLPLSCGSGSWAVDSAGLQRLERPVKCALLMNPAMLSGAVFTRADWQCVADFCAAQNAWLIYDAAMERILYDGTPYVHPAAIAGLAERTISVGSLSKEFRMIGWRVGWVVGPEPIMRNIAAVCVANVVTPVGIAAAAARTALELPADDFARALAEWQARRDALVAGFPADSGLTLPTGGWSLLQDISRFGLTSAVAAERLFGASIAVTPMAGWGSSRADRYVRYAFSNEPVSRLLEVGKRAKAALS